jgi:rhamnulose-1-phosphate aldolase
MDHPLYSLTETRQTQRVAKWLALLGWSEGGGGNFSVRLDGLPAELQAFPEGEPRSLPVEVPRLAGRFLLVTGTGTRARDIAEEPHEGLGLYKISKDGKSYAFLCGNDRPTSEMPSHLAIHQALEETRPEHRAIVHTHPPHLIAATHIPEFQDSTHMADVLLRMQSEASFHLADGLVHLPYHLPGSLELGLASAEAVRHCYIVIWHFHGALATGRTLSDALDYLQYLDKAAEVYWILRSAGIEPQGMKDDDIQQALAHFGRLERYQRWKGSTK